MAGVKMNERFWSQVEVGHPLGCWMWNGSQQSNGYGRFGKPRVPAHRYAYSQLVGPVPEGLQLDHLCRVPLCVNPGHLEPVTQRENIRRGVSPSARAMSAATCVNGHRWSPENTHTTKEGKRHCRSCHRDREHARKVKLVGHGGTECLGRYQKHWFGSRAVCKREGCEAPQPRLGRVADPYLAWQVQP